MSRKKKSQMQQEPNQRNQESHEQKEEKENTQAQVQIPSNAPATTRQRELLRLAVQREWLHPNPFACDHAKWKILRPVRRINFLPRSRGNGSASSNGN